MFFPIAEIDTPAMSGNYPNDSFRHLAGPRFGRPEHPAPDAKQGFFLFWSYYQTAGPKQVETDVLKTVPGPCLAPPLISPDTLLYYKKVNAAALIPIAFLVAGSVAIILTVYMYR